MILEIFGQWVMSRSTAQENRLLCFGGWVWNWVHQVSQCCYKEIKLLKGKALGSFPLTGHTTLSLCFYSLGNMEGRKGGWKNSVMFLYNLLLPTERINIFMENTAQTYTSSLRECAHESEAVGEHGFGICPSTKMICGFGRSVQTCGLGRFVLQSSFPWQGWLWNPSRQSREGKKGKSMATGKGYLGAQLKKVLDILDRNFLVVLWLTWMLMRLHCSLPKQIHLYYSLYNKKLKRNIINYLLNNEMVWVFFLLPFFKKWLFCREASLLNGEVVCSQAAGIDHWTPEHRCLLCLFF